MTPAARVAAAIDILDLVLSGDVAEKTLTTWARKNRYAGSGDRAAIRDLVFDALRCRRSFAWLGGADTGRGLMLGRIRAAGDDPAEVFTGAGYGPTELEPGEHAGPDLAEAPLPVQLDMPDWLMPALSDSLGGDLAEVCAILRNRAPVFLRVNIAQATRADAAEQLAAEGIQTTPHALASTALQVVSNPRRVQNSQAFRDGLVELQDAASQALVETLPKSARVLDYCAGGGGKSLAIAATGARVIAHDANPARMRDLAVRAERAGVFIETVETADLAACGPFDLVLCDAPCSGSGAWRRSPEAKWRLTPESLGELHRLQAEILDDARVLVVPGGVLVYATCSMFADENEHQAKL